MKQEQIVIRGINPELVRKLKVRVAEDQETIKGYVLGLLKRELRLPVDFEVEAQDGGEGKPSGVSVRRAEPGRAKSSKVAVRVGSSLPTSASSGTSGEGIRGRGEKRDTCPYHRDRELIQSRAKTYRAECPQCHADFPKRDGFSYEVQA